MELYMRIKVIAILLILLFYNSSVSSQTKSKYIPMREYKGQTIWDIANVKEENIDIGLWSLIIAKEYDNSIDINKYLEMLDNYSEEIKRMLAGRNKDMEKFLATKMFIYDSGKWNDEKPFSYDLDDPLGQIPENQLLSTYLETRKGNCVSMPTLFLALMERVDPNVPFHGVNAPLHLFCRLKDRQTGDVWNVEATNNGSPARNQWYIDQMDITQEAVDSGIYLKQLSKKDYIAELINILIRKERYKENYEKALQYTELSLRLSPNSINGLVHKSALLAWKGYELQKALKMKGEDRISPDDHKKLEAYSIESEKYWNKGLSLGWRPETKEQRDKYLNEIKNELKNRKE